MIFKLAVCGEEQLQTKLIGQSEREKERWGRGKVKVVQGGRGSEIREEELIYTSGSPIFPSPHRKCVRERGGRRGSQ